MSLADVNAPRPLRACHLGTSLECKDRYSRRHGHPDRHGRLDFPYRVSCAGSIGGSYIAGFFVGWVFRRVEKLPVVMGTLAIPRITFLKARAGRRPIEECSSGVSHETFRPPAWSRRSMGTTVTGMFLAFRKE